jgi:hypothetical protein
MLGRIIIRPNIYFTPAFEPQQLYTPVGLIAIVDEFVN